MFVAGRMRVGRSLPGCVAGCLMLAICLVAGSASAHGDAHLQIEALNKRIEALPRSAELLLRRAELQRGHRDFDAADAGYTRVLEIDPAEPEAHWLRARSRLEAGKPRLALEELDEFIRTRPTHPSARLTRARAYEALMRHAEAAAEFSEAIGQFAEPQPDVFVERLRAQQAAGIDMKVRLAGIQQGVATIGAIPAFEDAAFDIEIETRDWDAALARIDRRAAGAARKEYWYFRKGKVLAQAGKRNDAVEALQQCLKAVDGLPPALRATTAIATLARDARSEIERLK